MIDADPHRRPEGTGSGTAEPTSTGRALVVAAHGSHLHPRSVRPAFAHADRARATGRFDEVRAAFWKNEPSLREVLRTLASPRVVVVPLFTSEGYFVEEVVPRELRLTGASALDVPKDVRLADPVGTHERVTEVIVERAEAVTGDPSVGAGVGLAVVGHGTERNEHSARATRRHAARIRESGRFAAVRALFMDEPPYVADLADHFETRDVVVVPLFVADGLHTAEDIPEDVGLTDDHRDGWDVPATVGDHRVWYAGAVGTEPGFADVVLARAAEVEFGPTGGVVGADSKGGGAADPATTTGDATADQPPASADAGRRTFVDWIVDGGSRTWGELSISARRTDDGEGRFTLRHRDDVGRPISDLDVHEDPTAAREIAWFDEEGRFRPLSGAPTLRRGWALVDLDAAGLVRAVEWFYPASVAAWADERADDLAATHFRETAARQTGRYASVADASGEAIACAVEACCGDCVRRRVWEESAERPVDADRGDGAIPCREACSFLVAGLREWQDLAPETVTAASRDDASTVRTGAFDERGNRYRRRFLAATRARRDGGAG